MEACAKLYILKYHYADEIADNKIIIIFTANSAHLCGGAVYVDDDTNSGRMCTSGSKTECFCHVLALYSQNHINMKKRYIIFSQNQANISGSILYRGLLDRCAVSPFAKFILKMPVVELLT